MSILNTFFGKKEESDFKELVKNGALILDVRSKEEYNCGHIKGSLNIPLDTLPLHLKTIGDKERYIITCCLSGGRSTVAKNALNSLGYNNVHNGGGWSSLEKKLA